MTTQIFVAAFRRVLPPVFSRLMLGAVVLSFLPLAAGADAVALDFRLLRLDGYIVKWGARALGTSARVSYAVLDRPRRDPDNVNCRAMRHPARLLKSAAISETMFRRELGAAFDIWRQAAALEFVSIDDPSRADIVIGAQSIPRGIAYANVKFTEPVTGDIASLTEAVICLNPRVSWEVEPDSDLATFNLRRVLAHEIGHALGLNHPGPIGQLMGFRYAEERTRLGNGDLDGIRALYGARHARDG